MPWFRKHPADPENERIVSAFRASANRVDAAQRALLSAIPTSRDPGRPLEEAIDEFLEHLAGAEPALAAWHTEPLMHEWTSCSEAITAARGEAAQLRSGPSLGFEALNARVGEVIAPLEAFADAAGRVRRFARSG